MSLFNNHQTACRPLVVGLGEALFDCFPDRVVLGGAPMNVTVHADAILGPLGGAGVPVTRVGGDELGERFVSEARQRGLSTQYVQTDESRPTGRVVVTLDDGGHASYRFDTESAWDALEYDASLATLAGRCDGVAFGTLAQRNTASREAITDFVANATQAVRLFDVNLRQQYYSADLLDASLQLASAAKLNEEELREVCELLELRDAGSGDIDQAATLLSAAYRLDWLAITRGAEGTALYADGVKHTGAPASFSCEPNADTVGAGDACCAGLLCGTLLGYTRQATLGLANRLGAYVATRPGATPELPRSLLAMAPSESTAATDQA
ncbi:2-dehydro-3-deoxygluconokinase [Planctomycetes bacterium MalM25]|nr:2-dehydro-3-deoxygluconokinase [Planctomycetes bacterium MalM25]